MEKRWTLLEAPAATLKALQAGLNISPIICKILVQRDISSFDEARNFFRPQLADLHDPFLMKDMEIAVNRIRQAIEKGQKILVFGDYDVDGTTAVASMFQFLRKICQHVDFYIPHRYREGYGISRAGIDYARDNDFKLIISLDCGIKSVELIRYALELGIDFIVCDHHLPEPELPPAIAILNPKQAGCPYPYKELCGCGVGFKLITALTTEFKLPSTAPLEYLDLLATAIAADIVPMTGENRIMAYYGLKKANENPNHGIKALATLSGLDRQLSITNLVFMIAPRVNAAGRMDDARKAVEMFVAPDYDQALAFAKMLHSDNTDRKEADKTITDEALSLIANNSDYEGRKSTVVYQSHWHKGVVGIVASRLIETHFRPTVVLTKSGDFAAGSARGVPGFNLYEAIHACKDYLLGYGGHFAAAGLTIEIDRIDGFTKKFEEVVSTTIDPSLLVPEIIIDAEIRFSEIKASLYKILCQMEPFGPENFRPVFLSRRVNDTGFSKIVKEDHIRFGLRQDNVTLTGIGFGMAGKFSLLQSGRPLDIVFKIDENEWKGQTSLQLRMIDFRLSE